MRFVRSVGKAVVRQARKSKGVKHFLIARKARRIGRRGPLKSVIHKEDQRILMNETSHSAFNSKGEFVHFFKVNVERATEAAWKRAGELSVKYALHAIGEFNPRTRRKVAFLVMDVLETTYAMEKFQEREGGEANPFLNHFVQQRKNKVQELLGKRKCLAFMKYFNKHMAWIGRVRNPR